MNCKSLKSEDFVCVHICSLIHGWINSESILNSLHGLNQAMFKFRPSWVFPAKLKHYKLNASEIPKFPSLFLHLVYWERAKAEPNLAQCKFPRLDRFWRHEGVMAGIWGLAAWEARIGHWWMYSFSFNRNLRFEGVMKRSWGLVYVAGSESPKRAQGRLLVKVQPSCRDTGIRKAKGLMISCSLIQQLPPLKDSTTSQIAQSWEVSLQYQVTLHI